MELALLTKRLGTICEDITQIEQIVDYVALNVRAFTYANEPLSKLEIVIVLKNTGGYTVFKRVDGFIVSDKADMSYALSRELVGISNWNIKRAYRLDFTDGTPKLSAVSNRDLRHLLMGVIEPTWLRYAVGLEDGSRPTTLNVDMSLLRGLSYKDLKMCLRSSYCRTAGVDKDLIQEPSYFVVGYNKDKV